MRVVVAGGGTGGHLYPGLAIARSLVRLNPSVEPLFVGAQRGIERTVLPETEFEYELLDLHPLYRSRPWQNWKTLRGGVRAWKRLGEIFALERPAVVVGTGGYAAGAALARSVVTGIPTVLQEQNSSPGLTMRLFSRWAREIYLGFPEAARGLARAKRAAVLNLGNPIEPPLEPRPERRAALKQWNVPADARHVLLIVGGSQGARTLNEAAASVIHRLNSLGVFVIWATGSAHYESYARHASTMTRVRPYLSPIADAYAATDLALCRAGAITTAELCAWGIPSLLVPLPTAAADHQTANARALERAGCSLTLLEADMTPEKVVDLTWSLLQDSDRIEEMQAAARERGRPRAADDIATRILELIARNTKAIS